MAADNTLDALLGRMVAERQLSAADAEQYRSSSSVSGADPAEPDVLRWLAAEYAVGFDTLDAIEPEKDLLGHFPARILLREELLPLRRSNGHVEVATARLFATQGLDALRSLTGLRLQPVLAPREAIQREMKKHLGIGADTLGTLE